MRTAKCIVALVIAATAGLVAEAVEAPQPRNEPSGTRASDCLVRITADPAILPLNPETVTSLLYSSRVLGQAATKVLGSDAPQDPEGLVSIEWLSGTAWDPSESTPESLRDRQMLEQVYGREYAEMMMGTAPEDGQGTATKRNRQHDTPTYGTPYGDGPYDDGGAGSGQTVDWGATIKLSVRTPDGVRPVAREFLNALVANLRASLTEAHEEYVRSLDDLRLLALSQREDIEKRLEKAVGTSAPGELNIKQQLDTIVDLSAMTAQTPFKEAVEILRNSVQPPLPIVVQWNRLENMSIPPGAMAGIDGLESVRLRTALDLLVRSFDGIGYRIQDDVIVVAPVYDLPPSGAFAVKLKEPIDIRALAARKNELARNIQSLELDLAGMEAREKAIRAQMARAEIEARERLAQDAVTQELEKLVQLSTTQFDRLKQLADTGRLSQAELAQGQESVARARVDLARRREELAKQVSGARLEQFNNELSRMAIDKAEKQIQVEILRKQLNEAQRQVAQASTFDPEAARIRIAQAALDAINHRIGALETELATLEPPTVVVIGIN